jgi:hypothetical protein
MSDLYIMFIEYIYRNIYILYIYRISIYYIYKCHVFKTLMKYKVVTMEDPWVSSLVM